MWSTDTRSIGLAFVALTLVAALTGCSPGRMAALELDKVATSLDRYGFASISAPFLAGPSEDFRFDLNKPASYYFDEAFKPQGGVRIFEAEALDVQAAVRVNIEQALAVVAQSNRASIAEIPQIKRRAALQRKLLQTTVAAAAAAQPDLNENPLVKATIGMLGVIAEQPEPETDALPGFVPTTQPVATQPALRLEDRLALGASGGSFTAGRPFPEGPFQISAREALLIASGDVMTQSLLRWFLIPAGNKLGDYELYFCPVIVSVKPGYETRQNYQADVTVSVDLARKRTTCGNNLEFLSEAFPFSDPPIHVAGVFPVIDSQVLDLVSSRRRLYSMAFQLAMLGFGGEANVFIDYARKLEQDAQTQTALTVASAYTIGSTAFGFRVEPQFVALKDPAALEAEPGNILQSKTFPAMAVLLVHRSYLRSRDYVKDGGDPGRPGGWNDPIIPIEAGPKDQSPFRVVRKHFKAYRSRGVECDDGREAENGDSQPSGGSDATQCCCLSAQDGSKEKFDFLVLRTSTRWSPVKSGFLGPRRYSEVESWERAAALDKASDWITDHWSLWTLCDSLRKDSNWLHGRFRRTMPFGYQQQHLASRIRMLRQIALDTQALVRVYHTKPDDKIGVCDINPKRGWLDQYTVLNIAGHGFRGNVEYVSVGGRYCEFHVASNRSLLVLVPPWGKPLNEPPKNLGEFGEQLARLTPYGQQLTLMSPPLDPAVSQPTTDLQPLLPSETDLLKRLSKQKPAANTEDYKVWMDLKDKEKKYADYVAQRKQEQQTSNLWAEVAIASKVCVKVCTACSPCCVGMPARPGPDGAKVPDDLVKDGKLLNVGWILFNKKITQEKPSGAPKDGQVMIHRQDGRIVGVETKGGVVNGAQLLQLIADALRGPDAGDGDVHLRIEGAKIDTKATSQSEKK